MNQEYKRNPKNCTKEETDRVVAVFQWLLEQDKKQNPDLYKCRRGGQEKILIDKEGSEITL
jgi:hypothetical protein